MMFSEFLKDLEQKEIEISFSEGKIFYSGPEENITPAIIGKLKEYKRDFIKYYWPDECKNMISVNSEGSKTPYLFFECIDLSRLLSNYFGPDQPIYEFHNNTWTTGERFAHNTMESLAKDYINQLKKIVPNGPYIVGGHSFGGTLAYEIAVQLKKLGDEVPLIILFDTMSPYLYKPFNRQKSLTNILKIVFKKTVNKLMNFIRITVYKIIFLFRKFLPKTLWVSYIIVNYHMLLYKYRPEKLLVNILLFKASDESPIYKYDNGWGSLNSKIKVLEFEGDHLSIIRKTKNIEMMSIEIEKYLDAINPIN